MLRKLRLHNFKTFLNAEINFTQRHLLIGKNNSGKSNLCNALRFLQATTKTDLSQAAQFVPGGLAELTNWFVKSQDFEIECHAALDFEGDPLEYVYSLNLRVEGAPEPAARTSLQLRVIGERLLVRGGRLPGVELLRSDGREATMLHEESFLSGNEPPLAPPTAAPRDCTMLQRLYESPTNRRAVQFRNYLSNWSYFAFSPEHMRFGWSTPQSVLAGLFSRGDNLATVLFQLKNIDDQRYRRLMEHVQAIEPSLKALNFFPAPDQNPMPFVEMEGRSRASWTGLSDGTLRYLGLCLLVVSSSIYHENNPIVPLITIEEPENGVHPGFLRRLIDLFEDYAPQGQFVFTSHSPYFINMFDAFRESVTLLRRNKERSEIVAIPKADSDPDRELLAEQYSMELIG